MSVGFRKVDYLYFFFSLSHHLETQKLVTDTGQGYSRKTGVSFLETIKFLRVSGVSGWVRIVRTGTVLVFFL